MLSFDIDLSVPGTRDWAWDGRQWACRAGWIRPYQHPALTAEASVHGPHTTITVSEPAEDGDFVRLRIGQMTAQLQAGPLGRTPVYVRHRDGRLTGSWQITDIMNRLPFGALNERHTARMLTRRHRYSADTLFPDIMRLTERATITAGAAGMELTYPEPVPQPGRRALKAGVDPAVIFADLALRHMSNRQADAVELSGGVDSGVAAHDVLQAASSQVRSFGLIMPGRHRDAQRRRRSALTDALCLVDTEIEAMRHLPFGPGRRQYLHDPTSSYYCEAFDALASAAAAAGARTMATGFGGDELMACQADARPATTEMRLPAWLGRKARAAIEAIDDNTAPAAHLSHATLTALSGHAPGMLAVGIWPIAPLADPVLLRFCRQLPETWVVGKRLIRERLAQEADPAIASAASPESFRPVMQKALARLGLPLLDHFLRTGLLLADLGFIEPLFLQAAHNAARQQGKTIDSQLADVIRLELGLRRIWGEP